METEEILVAEERQTLSGPIIIVCALKHLTPEQVEDYINLRYPQKTEEREWKIYIGVGQAKFALPVTCETPKECDHYNDRIHYTLIDSTL